jgi:uncharacterized membrane protein
MSRVRSAILEWVEQGRLPRDAVPAAMRDAGILPGRDDWRRFLDLMLLWMGVIFCAAGVIFFFAFNWQAMGRFAKFGLVEGLILASLLMCWRLDLNGMAGKAALLAASLLVGALLALVGQTYQTGADTWELFMVWALAIFPWVVASRFGALWLVGIALANLAVALYFQAFGRWLGIVFDGERRLWALLALNTVALCVWEFAADRGVIWLRGRWPARILAVASGVFISLLAVWNVIEFRSHGLAVLAVYAAWMLAAYLAYRLRMRDVFVLAAGVLSLIIFIAALLSRQFLKHDNGWSFLFIGMVVIGLSAVGGLWLKSVATGEEGA